MKPISFRLKITLFSLLVSATVLVLISIFFLTMQHRIGLRQIDREMQMHGTRQLRPSRSHRPPPHHPAREGAPEHREMKVYDHTGELIFVSDNWPEALEHLISTNKLEAIHVARSGRNRNGKLRQRRWHSSPFKTYTIDRQHWRAAILKNKNRTVWVATDLTLLHDRAKRMLTFMSLVLPIGLGFLALGGWILSGLALRPVREIRMTAEQISGKDLTLRIPDIRSDVEFSQLSTVINDMLERLERSFSQARRFSADASHELKTPLAILQGELEQALQDADDHSPDQKRYASMLNEVLHLKAMVKNLLMLSKADAGKLALEKKPINLSELTLTLIDDAIDTAPDLAIAKNIEPDCVVAADAGLLQQAIHNLMSNAIKYNLEDGHIDISLKKNLDDLHLQISNTGPGICPEDQRRIFDRFYRGDQARTRNIDSTGLGLSLAQEIVQAHGGTLTMTESNEAWTRFLISLPSEELET